MIRGDVIVAGLGAMGGTTAYHLARRGLKVIGFDRFRPPHRRGSSHGHARVIREAYSRGPSYVPLVLRAIELWREWGVEAGVELVRMYGHLTIRSPEEPDLHLMRASASAYGLPLEDLSTEEIRYRYPMFRIEDGWGGLFEPRAGAVFPERCIQACLSGLVRLGADLRFDEPVSSWKSGAGGIEVRTPSGTYGAERLVVTAGAWVANLIAQLRPTVEIERLALFMFESAGNAPALTPKMCPNSSWGCVGVRDSFYTQPDFGNGFKVAFHHGRTGVDPDHPDRSTTDEEEARVRQLVGRFIPDAAGRIRESTACLYTNLPERDWVIDRHPDEPRVVIGSPCSGHGFKFASAIGEILADLATDRTPSFDITPFSLGHSA